MVPLVTNPAAAPSRCTRAPARTTPLSSRVIAWMRRGRSPRRLKSPCTIARSAWNCRCSAARPMNSPLSSAKLTAKRASPQAKIGISHPSGSSPSSWP